MFNQAVAQLRNATPRRTHQPVRRNSRLAGKCESVFWKKTDHKSVDAILLAAKRYDRQMKQPGKKNGPLGLIALQVLDYFANIIDHRTGRLEPSYDTLMAKVGASRDAIHRALNALREHGFIDWLKRYVPTNNDGAGPQVKQTSNAYRLSLPARAKAALGKYFTQAPTPEDAAQAREEREDAIAAHKASLTPAERIRESVEDTELGDRFAGFLERHRASKEAGPKPVAPTQDRLFEITPESRKESARILDRFRKKRESENRTESRSSSNIE